MNQDEHELALAVVVTPDLEVLFGIDVEHDTLLDVVEDDRDEFLIAKYWPDSNLLFFTWPDRMQDFGIGGRFEDQFNVLYSYLSEQYPKFGTKTKIKWMAKVGIGGRIATLGEEYKRLASRRRPAGVAVRSYPRKKCGCP